MDKFGNTPLADAIKHSHSNCINYIINHGGIAHINKGYLGNSNIYIAASKGNYEEVYYRLQVNPKVALTVDYDQRTPLHLAAVEGHDKIVELLLEYGAEKYALDRWNNLPYHDAKLHKHYLCAKLLKINNDTIKNSINSFDEHSPLLLNHPNINQDAILIRSNSIDNKLNKKISIIDRELLQCVSNNDDDKEMIELIHRGADINISDYDDRSVLHLICTAGHMKQALVILNENSLIIDRFDRFANTPLQDYINHNHMGLAKLLYDNGATVVNAKLATQLCELSANGNLLELKS